MAIMRCQDYPDPCLVLSTPKPNYGPKDFSASGWPCRTDGWLRGIRDGGLFFRQYEADRRGSRRNRLPRYEHRVRTSRPNTAMGSGDCRRRSSVKTTILITRGTASFSHSGYHCVDMVNCFLKAGMVESKRPDSMAVTASIRLHQWTLPDDLYRVESSQRQTGS